MIPLPTVQLTGQIQVVNLQTQVSDFPRIIITNKSLMVAIVSSGSKSIRLQAYNADLLELDAPNFTISPETNLSAPGTYEIQAINKDEQLLETYPQTLTIPAEPNLMGLPLPPTLVVHDFGGGPPGTGVNYYVVPITAANQDGPPSPPAIAFSFPFLAGSHPNIDIQITPVAGAIQYKILRKGIPGLGYSGFLEALIGANPLPVGQLTFADLGNAGTGIVYNPSQFQVVAPLVVAGITGALFDISDRAARLLGRVMVDSITAAVDFSDRATRLLGVISSITNPVDVSDRAGRLLGRVVVDSITAAIDFSDRATRLLGVISSITNPVDVSDRAGRLLGGVLDGPRATYSASAGGPSGIIIVAMPTDVFIIRGSATKTIRVLRVEMIMFNPTPARIVPQLIKRSTADTGGTFNADIAVSYDSNDVAATATVGYFSINPAVLGTIVGTIRLRDVWMPAGTTTTDPFPFPEGIFEFGNRPGAKAIVLRGANEMLAINFQGAAAPGGSVLVAAFEWTEE